MDSNANNVSISNLTNNQTSSNAGDTHQRGSENREPIASAVSQTDTSLLHQITSLQKENQDLLQKRREMEGVMKEIETRMKDAEVVHSKEKQEFVEVQRKEMEQHFKGFMQDWMASMEKENPAVIERMKGGVDKLIEGGRNKDKMWEILCCASKTHKNNVNAIEELTKTNGLLMERNKELEGIARTQQGFSYDDSRIGKRMRANDVTQGGSGGGADVGSAPDAAQASAGGSLDATDCWGHFETLLANSQKAATYY